MRRTCRRIRRKTGIVTNEIKYVITSLTSKQTPAAALETLWRGHWTIENQVNYVRDVTMREDAGQVRAGHAPHVFAAFRKVLLNLYRANGWYNMSDAVRFYGANVSRAFICSHHIQYDFDSALSKRRAIWGHGHLTCVRVTLSQKTLNHRPSAKITIPPCYQI